MSGVLALDLASVSGWAVGDPGSEPAHGTIRFASQGASPEAIFANAFTWTGAIIEQYHPSTVVWEAPILTPRDRGSSTGTATILIGLPAVVGAAAYLAGIFDLRKADSRGVRMYFLGCNPKRNEAKPKVVRQCMAMGWTVEDDNEADALATWSYMCGIIKPELALAPTPLFGRSA